MQVSQLPQIKDKLLGNTMPKYMQTLAQCSTVADA